MSELPARAPLRSAPLIGVSLIGIFLTGTIFASDKPAKHCLFGELRIRRRHRVPLQQESVRTTGNEAVKEEPAFPQREHNLARPRIFQRTTRDLNHVPGPKNRQHAFAVHLQTQTAAAPQKIGGQS
ncbi:MAG: hypothetical protein WCC04_11020 [Terriglobales bacterium]